MKVKLLFLSLFSTLCTRTSTELITLAEALQELNYIVVPDESSLLLYHGDQIPERRRMIAAIVQDMLEKFPPDQFSENNPFVYTGFGTWGLQQEYETVRALIKAGYHHIKLYCVDNAYLQEEPQKSTPHFAEIITLSQKIDALDKEFDDESDEHQESLLNELKKLYPQINATLGYYNPLTNRHLFEKIIRAVLLPIQGTFSIFLETPTSYLTKIQQEKGIMPLFADVQSASNHGIELPYANELTILDPKKIISDNMPERGYELIYTKIPWREGMLFSRAPRDQLNEDLKALVTAFESNKTKSIPDMAAIIQKQPAFIKNEFTLQYNDNSEVSFLTIIHDAARDNSRIYTLLGGLENPVNYKVYSKKEYLGLPYNFYKFFDNEDEQLQGFQLF